MVGAPLECAPTEPLQCRCHACIMTCEKLGSAFVRPKPIRVRAGWHLVPLSVAFLLRLRLRAHAHSALHPRETLKSKVRLSTLYCFGVGEHAYSQAGGLAASLQSGGTTQCRVAQSGGTARRVTQSGGTGSTAPCHASIIAIANWAGRDELRIWRIWRISDAPAVDENFIEMHDS